MLRWTCAGALLALLAGSGAAQGVRIVTPAGNLDFDQIHEAVAAALDGEVLLVGAGSYAPFTIDGKSLSVLAAPGAVVTVQGTIQVLNVPAGGLVLLQGLRSLGPMVTGQSGPGLRVLGCAGHVRFQDCQFEGGHGAEPGCTPTGSGGPGAVVDASLAVLFVASSLIGGHGYTKSNCCCWGGDGGPGLQVLDAVVALYDCTTRGAAGGTSGEKGGHGGSGTRVWGGGLFAAGSSFIGGKGGNAEDIFATSAGFGGNGLELDEHQAHLLDNTYAGGLGGKNFGFGGGTGPNGLPIAVLAGSVIHHLGAARKFGSPALFGDSTPAGAPAVVPVAVEGEPGDSVWLLQSSEPAFQVFAAGSGVRTVSSPVPVPRTPLGTIPAGGTLVLNVPAGSLPPGALAKPRFLQGLVVDAQGQSFLGSPIQWMRLDRDSPPDCDANGSSDYVDAVEGVGPDCNADLVPDSCQIASGTSQDCNANAVPDECDIESGASKDVNQNGLPDECEAVFATWYVDDDAAPGGNGSLASPFQTIGAALAVSFSGDTVIVLDGVYKGAGNKNLSFGGYDVVVRSQNGPASCIVDCENSGRAFKLDDQETTAARIQGLTIRNGNGSSSPLSGGAIVVQPPAGVTIDGCVFSDCTALSLGGALFVSSPGALVQDCKFLGNQASSGGAMLVGGEVVVRRCHFEGNTASEGAGLTAWATLEGSISHCSFLNNAASSRGGALQIRGHSNGLGWTIDDCLIAGNSGNEGGGIVCDNQTASFGPNPVRINQCTIVGNSAGRGGGLLVRSASQVRAENSIFWGNSAAVGPELALDPRFPTLLSSLFVSACDVQGGQGAVFVGLGSLSWGPGNLDLDPLFVDPLGPDLDASTVEDNDYRLAAGSPCVDAGHNPLVAPDLADIDGDGNTSEPVPLDLDDAPRFVDDPAAPDAGIGPPPVVDLGAFERP